MSHLTFCGVLSAAAVTGPLQSYHVPTHSNACRQSRTRTHTTKAYNQYPTRPLKQTRTHTTKAYNQYPTRPLKQPKPWPVCFMSSLG